MRPTDPPAGLECPRHVGGRARMPRTRPRRDYCTRSTTAPQHLLAPPSRFYTPRDIATPRARRARARTAWRERASRGLFRGGRDLFLHAVVVENDAGEYELQHDEVAEIARVDRILPTRVMASARLPRQSPLFNYSHALFRRNCANAARQYTCRGGLCAIRGP